MKARSWRFVTANSIYTRSAAKFRELVFAFGTFRDHWGYSIGYPDAAYGKPNRRFWTSFLLSLTLLIAPAMVLKPYPVDYLSDELAHHSLSESWPAFLALAGTVLAVAYALAQWMMAARGWLWQHGPLTWIWKRLPKPVRHSLIRYRRRGLQDMADVQ